MLKILATTIILISTCVSVLSKELPDFTQLLGKESYEEKTRNEFVTNYIYHTNLEIEAIKSKVEAYLGDNWTVMVVPKEVIEKSVKSTQSEEILAMLLITNPDLPDLALGANLFLNAEKRKLNETEHKYIFNLVLTDLSEVKKSMLGQWLIWNYT